MEYSVIDWDSDFSWQVLVASSDECEVDGRRWNLLIPDLRKQILSYLSWMDEMTVFERHPWLVHPWRELALQYGVKPTDPGWL